MSSGPQQVRLKRKRHETAPDTLILQPNKRSLAEDLRTQLRYTRKSEKAAEAFSAEEAQKQQHDLAGQSAGKERSRPSGRSGNRTFHLSRAGRDRVTKAAKKRRGKDAVKNGLDIATFVEKRPDTGAPEAPVNESLDMIMDGEAVVPPVSAAPQKRPGRGSAVSSSRNGKAAGAALDHERMQSMADALHRFALDELTEVAKQRVTALPKYTGRRRQPEQAGAPPPKPKIRDDEMDVDSDGDYVYDTYVLAPAADAAPTTSETGVDLGDIGYLVITDEDQSIWEAYLEEDESDKDWDTDDEDENAEDYYGADYPEDELASDDEFDRDVHGYRVRGAADDEEWDEDTGAYSDEEYERTMNPWKARTPAQYARTLRPDDGAE